MGKDEQRTLYGRLLRIISNIDFWPGFTIEPSWHNAFGVDEVYFEVVCKRTDAITSMVGNGRGGKRLVLPKHTDDQIVRAILGALLSYQEHEVREGFRYMGKQIFSPHITIDALIEAADHQDWQEDKQEHE